MPAKSGIRIYVYIIFVSNSALEPEHIDADKDRVYWCMRLRKTRLVNFIFFLSKMRCSAYVVQRAAVYDWMLDAGNNEVAT